VTHECDYTDDCSSEIVAWFFGDLAERYYVGSVPYCYDCNDPGNTCSKCNPSSSNPYLFSPTLCVVDCSI